MDPTITWENSAMLANDVALQVKFYWFNWLFIALCMICNFVIIYMLILTPFIHAYFEPSINTRQPATYKYKTLTIVILFKSMELTYQPERPT